MKQREEHKGKRREGQGERGGVHRWRHFTKVPVPASGNYTLRQRCVAGNWLVVVVAHTGYLSLGLMRSFNSDNNCG